MPILIFSTSLFSSKEPIWDRWTDRRMGKMLMWHIGWLHNDGKGRYIVLLNEGKVLGAKLQFDITNNSILKLRCRLQCCGLKMMENTSVLSKDKLHRAQGSFRKSY